MKAKENVFHLKAGQIYTGEALLQNQYLSFEGDKIKGLSAKPTGQLHGSYPFITPAFIDAHSHIGINRHGDSESESNDRIDSIEALHDVLDSVQMDDESLRTAIEFGSLYSCVVPGSANIISGQSAVIRHHAPHSTAALIGRAGVKAAFGTNTMNPSGNKAGARPSTRRGAVHLLRARLSQVRAKLQRIKEAAGKSAEWLTEEEQVFKSLLEGGTRLRAHAHKIDDIASLLRLKDEFGLEISVEHASNVNRPEIFEELRKRGVTIVYGPPESKSSKTELMAKNWRNGKLLLESGADFCVMTDHPVTPAWSILHQTRFLMRCGLDKLGAMKAVTSSPARFLGIDDRLGTLEKGKWASFVCWNGDPFDIASSPVAVFGEGELLYEA